MKNTQKFVYNVVLGLVGILLVTSATVLYFAHFRLGEFESTAGQVTLLFSEDAQQEYQTLENLRVLSGALLMVSFPIAVVGSHRYYEQSSDPKREMKTGFAGGIFLTLFGGLYYYFATNLPAESLSFALLFLGGYATLSNSAYLVGYEEDSSGGSSNSGSYCTDCGNDISVSDSYCPDCGSKL